MPSQVNAGAQGNGYSPAGQMKKAGKRRINMNLFHVS